MQTWVKTFAFENIPFGYMNQLRQLCQEELTH